MNITSVTACKWNNAEHSSFDCVAKFQEYGDTKLPYTASASDAEPHGIVIWEQGNAGAYGAIAEFVEA